MPIPGFGILPKKEMYMSQKNEALSRSQINC